MSSDKKRKRSTSVPPDIKVTTVTTGDTPPILMASHGITLPQSLSFSPYTCALNPRASGKSSKRGSKFEYLLHGSTLTIDYEGREVPEDSQYHRYYVGIYDPATNTVELHVAPKLHFTRTIKAHAERDQQIEEKGVKMNNADSRAALGLQFGTKKAQKALLSKEMNRIDISDMNKSVTTSIISQVEENTKNMPTSSQLGSQLMDMRPIPYPNKDATKPEDTYQLEDIIPKEEWNVLWVREWENGRELKSSTKSRYVTSRAAKLIASKGTTDSSPRHQLRSLKILRYIAHMIDFYLFQLRGRGRLPAMDKTKNALGLEQVLVEGFYKRYAEKTFSGEGPGGNDRWGVSPSLVNKLLYYMAVLCLMVDMWEVDLFELRLDLGLQMKELAMAFKEVGCSIKGFSKTQYMAMKMTKVEASQHKRAFLKIPLQFPNAPKRRATLAGRR